MSLTHIPMFSLVVLLGEQHTTIFCRCRVQLLATQIVCCPNVAV